MIGSGRARQLTNDTLEQTNQAKFHSTFPPSNYVLLNTLFNSHKDRIPFHNTIKRVNGVQRFDAAAKRIDMENSRKNQEFSQDRSKVEIKIQTGQKIIEEKHEIDSILENNE